MLTLPYGISVVTCAAAVLLLSSSDTHPSRRDGPPFLPTLLHVAWKTAGPGIKPYRLLRDRVPRQKFRGLRYGCDAFSGRTCILVHMYAEAYGSVKGRD